MLKVPWYICMKLGLWKKETCSQIHLKFKTDKDIPGDNQTTLQFNSSVVNKIREDSYTIVLWLS